MKEPKEEQLRVRLTKEERRSLERLMCKGDNLSDVVRRMIAVHTGPETAVMLRVPTEVYRSMVLLGDFLSRAPEDMAVQCMRDVFDALQYPNSSVQQLPLVMIEYQVRAEYKRKFKKDLPKGE